MTPPFDTDGDPASAPHHPLEEPGAVVLEVEAGDVRLPSPLSLVDLRWLLSAGCGPQAIVFTEALRHGGMPNTSDTVSPEPRCSLLPTSADLRPRVAGWRADTALDPRGLRPFLADVSERDDV